MNVLKIVINSVEDAKAGTPIVDTSTKENMQEGEMTFAYLEKGMKSGKTSVMVIIKLADGTHAIGECSGDNFEKAHSAFKGAKERFGS